MNQPDIIDTLRTQLRARSLDDAVWKRAVRACSTDLTRVSLLKIDPIAKKVEVCALMNSNAYCTESDAEVIPSLSDLQRLSELPQGGMLRTSKIEGLGTIWKWTDMDCMSHREYPGFTLKGLKTLKGIALIMNIQTVDTDFGCINLAVDIDEGLKAFVEEHVKWLDAETASKQQDEEYRASVEIAKRMYAGKNVRVVAMR